MALTLVEFTDPNDEPCYINPERVMALGMLNGLTVIVLEGGERGSVKEAISEVASTLVVAVS